MEIFTKYTFGNRPDLLPLEDYAHGKGYPDDDTIEALGFNPEDEELCLSQLSADWKGHKKGAAVILTLTIEGYDFAVENPPQAF